MQRATAILFVFFSMGLIMAKFDASYHTYSNPQYKKGKMLVDAFQLEGNEAVLDVGCGTGRVTVECAKKIPQGSITGIDISEDMIAFAKEEYKAYTNVVFQACDIADVSFEELFDFVYSTYCLQWVAEQKKAIENIARSLKPGGNACLLIGVPNRTVEIWDQSCVAIAKKYSEFSSLAQPEHNLKEPEKWITWCADAGLTITKRVIETKKTIFNTIDDFIGFASALGIASGLKAEERKRFIGLVAQKMYKKSGQAPDLPFEYITDALQLECYK